MSQYLSTLQEAILLAVSSQKRYGLEISSLVNSASGGKFSLSQGSLYPVLQQLQFRGLVLSSWGDDQGRLGARRRYYEITDLGRQCLLEKHQFLKTLAG